MTTLTSSLFSLDNTFDEIDTRVIVKQTSKGTQHSQDKRDDIDSTNVSNNRQKQCMLLFCYLNTQKQREPKFKHMHNY